jgi:opacity protein-like surface antigen
MKLRIALLAATILAAPFAVHAQPVDGLYIAGGAGADFLQTENLKKTVPAHANIGYGSNYRFDVGPVVAGSVGYGLGNGLRFEIEGLGTDNKLNKVKDARAGVAGGDEYKAGVFVNALYDVPLALPVVPFVGVGVGYVHNWFSNVLIANPTQVIHSNGQNDNLGVQGILGVSYPLYSFVPGLSLTAEYRFLAEPGGRGYGGEYFSGRTSSLIGQKFATDDFNNMAMIGFRYAFNTSAPPPPPAAVVQPPPSQPARTYLVFFDWDRADLTERARQIIAEAAAASTHVSYTKIDVQGNADRSGTPAYNQRLSLRRAETVAAELVRRGVPRTAIEIQAFGDTRPLVPTAPGVREPQNRRVAIILR